MSPQRDLPAGWRWVCLGEVIEALETGSRPLGGALGIFGGVPSLSAEHITPNGNFDFTTMRYVHESFYDTMSRGRIRVGDILVVKDGATTGKSCLIRNDFPFERAVINEHVFICRLIKQMADPQFVFYWMWGPDGHYQIKSQSQGSAIGGISQSFVDNLQVPLPPLAEQQRIAAVLRDQMAAVDRARAAARARLAAVNALPAAYLRAAFPRPGQPLPAGWRWVRLGDTSALLPSRSIASDGDAQVRAVTTACLTESGFNPDGVKTARMQAADVQDCTVGVGEVLIARSNTLELVGRACLFGDSPEKVVASDLTIRIRANGDLVPACLAGYLSALFVRGFWRAHAGGASGSMKKITRTQVEALLVPLPPLAEQQRLAAVLGEQMAAVARSRAAAEGELKAIEALPASLLRRAFSGEV